MKNLYNVVMFYLPITSLMFINIYAQLKNALHFKEYHFSLLIESKAVTSVI